MSNTSAIQCLIGVLGVRVQGSYVSNSTCNRSVEVPRRGRFRVRQWQVLGAAFCAGLMWSV